MSVSLGRSSFALALIAWLAFACTVRADEPKPGAPSAAELIVKLADAIVAGDAAAVRSCFDLTKPASKDYAEYLAKIADMSAARNALLKSAEAKYGAAVRARVEPLLVRQWASAEEYDHLREMPASKLKVGGKFYPPRFKGEAAFVKTDAGFLLDGADVLVGVDKDYLKEEVAKFVKYGADLKIAGDTATSEADLLAKLGALKD
jgi:hypothetical protein